MQSVLNEPESEVWARIAPLLDAAVARLREKDRQAIVLRFYEGRNLREVGDGSGRKRRRSGKSASAARLEKLRKCFARHGIGFHHGNPGRGDFRQLRSSRAGRRWQNLWPRRRWRKGRRASGSTLTLVKGALKLMAWTKMKTAAVAGAGILLAAGTTGVMIYLQPPATARSSARRFQPD